MTTLILCLGLPPDLRVSCPLGEAFRLELPCGEADMPIRWELYNVNWHILGRRALPRFERRGAAWSQVYEFTPLVATVTSFRAIHADGNEAPTAIVNVHVNVTADAEVALPCGHPGGQEVN
jgi:hypothetical protein